MTLAVDVGNSNVKMGLFSGETLLDTFRYRTVSEKTADEYSIDLNNALNENAMSSARIERVVISSVVPRVTSNFREMTEKRLGITPLVVGAGVKTGLKITIESPTELGSDLVAGAVAAFHLTQRSTIIVTFGTALVFTCVNRKGELLGVSICVGLETALDSLAQGTVALKQIELRPPGRVIGRNTTESMQSGLVYGFVGQVEYLITKLKSELEENPDHVDVLTTGYHGQLLLPLTGALGRYEKDLILHGLNLISSKAASSRK